MDAVKLSVDPAQIGELLDAVGAAGVEFTTTVVVPAALVHPATVTVTEYVPAIASVAPGRVGFCSAEVNPPGPVHEYVAPATAGVLKLIVLPVQTGLLLLAVGVAGVGLMVIGTCKVSRQPKVVVVISVTVYVPPVAYACVGFVAVEVPASPKFH